MVEMHRQGRRMLKYTTETASKDKLFQYTCDGFLEFVAVCGLSLRLFEISAVK